MGMTMNIIEILDRSDLPDKEEFKHEVKCCLDSIISYYEINYFA